MRSDILQFLFYAVALVIGGAAEEVLPKVFGVGVPVLMALVVSVAVRKSAVASVLVALAAGAFEDALSSLPMMTSPCFFLSVVVLVRKTRFGKSAFVLAYPLYQVWMKLIVPRMPGMLGFRLAAAILIATIVSVAVIPFFAWLERKASVDAA